MRNFIYTPSNFVTVSSFCPLTSCISPHSYIDLYKGFIVKHFPKEEINNVQVQIATSCERFKTLQSKVEVFIFIATLKDIGVSRLHYYYIWSIHTGQQKIIFVCYQNKNTWLRVNQPYWFQICNQNFSITSGFLVIGICQRMPIRTLMWTALL